MPRRLLAALAALALAVQAGGALAAFADEPDACSCPRRNGKHECRCPDCAQHRHQASGRCSLGGCSESGEQLLAPAPLASLPVLEPAQPPLPRPTLPAPLVPWPPRAPSREVPTPPPLA
jgi:hypothetical protein